MVAYRHECPALPGDGLVGFVDPKEGLLIPEKTQELEELAAGQLDEGSRGPAAPSGDGKERAAFGISEAREDGFIGRFRTNDDAETSNQLHLHRNGITRGHPGEMGWEQKLEMQGGGFVHWGSVSRENGSDASARMVVTLFRCSLRGGLCGCRE